MFIHAAKSFPELNGTRSLPGIELVPKAMSRRLTPPLRHAMGCALASLEQAGVPVPDGIHYGTGLGCLTDTQAFIQEIDRNAGGLLSPTSFMRSTHNTVAGLLALALKATGPNLTFSQGLLSLHGALVSARTQLLERPKDKLLVGASDEHIPLLDALSTELYPSRPKAGNSKLSEGGGSLVVGSEPGDLPVCITAVWTGAAGSAAQVMGDHKDLVLIGPHWEHDDQPFAPESCRTIRVQELTGMHQSVPARSLVHAVELICSGEASSVWISDREQDRAGLIHVERC